MRCPSNIGLLKFSLILWILPIFLHGCGTVSTLQLADASNPYNRIGPHGARELKFRFPNYECENPSEFIKLPYIYSGTMRNILFLSQPFNCGGSHGELGVIHNAISILISPLIIVDIPLSLVADTLLLPFTISHQIKEGNIVDPPYFRMGNLARRKGNDDQAREYYEKGFKVLPKYYGNKPYFEMYSYLPDFDEITEYFANYHEQRGEYDKAIFYYEQLVEIAIRYEQGPSGPIVKRYKQLERIYTIAGKHDKATACRDKANEYAHQYGK